MKVFKGMLVAVALLLLHSCGSSGTGASDERTQSDLEVIEQLKAYGDVGSIEREVDHYAYFDSQDDAQKYADEAAAEGFTVQRCEKSAAEGDESYVVHLVRIHKAVPETVHEITGRLTKLAEANNGYYDGWGCAIVTGQ